MNLMTANEAKGSSLVRCWLKASESPVHITSYGQAGGSTGCG